MVIIVFNLNESFGLDSEFAKLHIAWPSREVRVRGERGIVLAADIFAAWTIVVHMENREKQAD